MSSLVRLGDSAVARGCGSERSPAGPAFRAGWFPRALGADGGAAVLPRARGRIRLAHFGPARAGAALGRLRVSNPKKPRSPSAPPDPRPPSARQDSREWLREGRSMIVPYNPRRNEKRRRARVGFFPAGRLDCAAARPRRLRRRQDDGRFGAEDRRREPGEGDRAQARAHHHHRRGTQVRSPGPPCGFVRVRRSSPWRQTAKNPWWRFWRKDRRKKAASGPHRPRADPELQEGQATLRAEATTIPGPASEKAGRP